MDAAGTDSTPGDTDQQPALITVRYWAAARAAAGVTEEKYSGSTVAEVLDAARAAHPDQRFARVLGVCSFLLSERPVGSRDLALVPVAPGDSLDVLPPFAGG